MLTIALIIAHARTKNPEFNPDLLYVGTLIADIAIAEALFK